jgi:uncharacterized membrane protein (UPF0136 family)
MLSIMFVSSFYKIVLWIYVVLLLSGGLMGFLKAKSKISLITSAAFALPLALCALAVIPPYPIAPILLALLALVFVVRYLKGKKFMPSGLMAILSIAFFIIVCWVYVETAIPVAMP